MSDPVRDRLAVALDVPDLDRARALIQALDDVPGWLKVGSELFAAAGPSALVAAAAHARVFLDAKWHDIPRTVAAAVAAATRRGVGMLTLHAGGGSAMLRAAREAAADAAAAARVARPQLLGVTVLTSQNDAALKEVGVPDGVERQVERLVDLALAAGLDGVVASAREAASIRARVGGALRIVTPGIRAAGARPDDQRRTASAREAIRAGADVVVVGRPVVTSSDPAGAARALLAEIEQGIGESAP